MNKSTMIAGAVVVGLSACLLSWAVTACIAGVLAVAVVAHIVEDALR